MFRNFVRSRVCVCVCVVFLCCLCLCGVVNIKAENIMCTEERRSNRFQHEGLGVRMWWIIVTLQSSKDVYQHTTVKHRLRVDRRQHTVNVLKREALQFFENLCRALNLLPFERHEG